MSTTPLSKAPTEPTQPLSSVEKAAESEPPSKPSASSENIPNSTRTIRKSSTPTLHGSISDKSRDHALLMKASLLQLKKAGLVKLLAVLSEDGQVKEMKAVFDPSIWTKNLELIEHEAHES